MLATIELPNNKNEIAFILEVLKRLNVNIVYGSDDEILDESTVEEHSAILKDRRAAMQSADAQYFTWEDAQQILANRKTAK